MIQNKDILNWLQRVLRKEARGNILSPTDFNTFLAVNQRLRFDERMKQMELTDGVTSSMSVYVKSKLLTLDKVPIRGSAVYGEALLPSGYEKTLSCMTDFEGLRTAKVDLVTHLEMQERMSNSLTCPSVKHPLGMIEGGKLIVYPYVASVRLTYVQTPAKAFLDYVVNTSNRTVRYLDADVDVTVGVNEVWPNKLHNEDFTSNTHEMEWSDEDKIAVAHKILRGVAPAVQDQGAFQLGSEETQKAERL